MQLLKEVILLLIIKHGVLVWVIPILHYTLPACWRVGAHFHLKPVRYIVSFRCTKTLQWPLVC